MPLTRKGRNWFAGVIGLTGLAAAVSSRAQDLSYDQLPDPVRRTVQENRGAGEVKQIEVFPFGNVKIYKVQIAINGTPVEEIEVAENGKLIRLDPVGTPAEPDEDDGN